MKNRLRKLVNDGVSARTCCALMGGVKRHLQSDSSDSLFTNNLLSPPGSALNADFKLSKLAKSLTGCTFLCSAVLFFAVAGTNSALADDITLDSPITADPGESYDGNLTIEPTEGTFAVYPSEGSISLSSTDGSNYSLTINIGGGSDDWYSGIYTGNSGTSVTVQSWKELNINSKGDGSTQYQAAEGITAISGTITINNVDSIGITVSDAYYAYGVDSYGSDISIATTGDTKISLTDNTYAVGIYATDDVEITTGGAFEIAVSGSTDEAYGIWAESGSSVSIGTAGDAKINVDAAYAAGIYTTDKLEINSSGNVEITAGGNSSAAAYGIVADFDGINGAAGSIEINAANTVSITATAPVNNGLSWATHAYWGSQVNISAKTVNISSTGGGWGSAGIYLEYYSPLDITAANISISADDEVSALGIYGLYFSETTLVGTDSDEGKLEINVNKSVTPTTYYYYNAYAGVYLTDSVLSVSNFASADITVNGPGGVGLYTQTQDLDYGTSTIKFDSIGTISIDAEMGVLAHRVDFGQEASISLTATDKISITSNDSTGELLAGVAVTSAFSVDNYEWDAWGGAGADPRIAEVTLSSKEVEIDANQAFAAVITHQAHSYSMVSLQDGGVKPLAVDGTTVNSIINVTADTLTVTASDFVAAAYMDLTAYFAFCDWDDTTGWPTYNPDYDYGETGQINLNVTVDSSGTPTIYDGTSTLTGNVFASHNSQVNIGLKGSTSSWTGFSQDSRVDPIVHTVYGESVEDTIPGEVNVYATDGATWNVRPIKETTIKENYSSGTYGEETADLTVSGTKSYLTTWNSSGSSVINLNLTGATDVSYYGNEYQSVDIKYLQGSGTEFQVHTNIDGDRGSDLDLSSLTTDHAIIHSGEGAHYINVAVSGDEVNPTQDGFLILHLEEDGATSTKISIDAYDESDSTKVSQTTASGDGLSFVLSNGTQDGLAGGIVAGGLYYYTLVTRDAEDPENYGGEEGKGTEWYLVRAAYVDNTEPDPDPNPDPNPDPDSNPNPGDTGPGPASDPETNEGRTVAGLAGIGNKLSMHYAQLSDLRKRLGEVRYGAQDGLWVRYIYQRNRYDGVSSNVSARQNMHALNLGLDHIISQDEDRMWLLGGDFKLGHDNEHIKSAKGKGNLNSYGVDLYATYANQFGCYADLVFSFDKYHQKLGSKLEDNSSASGNFNTWGWGASIEVGKMFSSTKNDENWGPWHNHWWVEPQAQLSYYWIKGKDFSMNNGMTVSQHNGDSLVGRLGVVVGKQWSYGGANKVDKRYVQAYLKGGVKHEFLGNQKTKINGVNFDHNLRGTTGYYGGGVDWNLTKQVKAYAQVERDAGGRYKKDIEASIGLKWQF